MFSFSAHIHQPARVIWINETCTHTYTCIYIYIYVCIYTLFLFPTVPIRISHLVKLLVSTLFSYTWKSSVRFSFRTGYAVQHASELRRKTIVAIKFTHVCVRCPRSPDVSLTDWTVAGIGWPLAHSFYILTLPLTSTNREDAKERKGRLNKLTRICMIGSRMIIFKTCHCLNRENHCRNRINASHFDWFLFSFLQSYTYVHNSLKTLLLVLALQLSIRWVERERTKKRVLFGTIKWSNNLSYSNLFASVHIAIHCNKRRWQGECVCVSAFYFIFFYLYE